MSDEVKQADNVLAYREVYKDTLYFVEGLTSEYDFYPAILDMLRNGNMSVELKKKYVFKAIDEMWIRTIEDSLIALDTIIRTPSRFIEQQEKVLPIELSRNINSRSIVHLSQHTDYISKVEGDEITPSKILNVFNEETMLTYENKFVNTLINRLFAFVAKRYDAMKQNGRSEKNTLLRFSGDFEHGKSRGRINFEIELSEEPDAKAANAVEGCSLDLWDRVERLYSVTMNYMSSEFVKNMGKAFISPPVMRTNAILKNKNLKQCLALWEFIASYEDTGYGVSVREDAERADEEYIRELYSTCALQYLIFRYKIKNDFEEDKTLESAKTDKPIIPKFVTEIKPFTAEDYNVFDSQYMRVVPYKSTGIKRMSKSEKEMAHAIDVALTADLIYDAQRADDYEKYKQYRLYLEELSQGKTKRRKKDRYASLSIVPKQISPEEMPEPIEAAPEKKKTERRTKKPKTEVLEKNTDEKLETAAPVLNEGAVELLDNPAADGPSNELSGEEMKGAVGIFKNSEGKKLVRYEEYEDDDDDEIDEQELSPLALKEYKLKKRLGRKRKKKIRRTAEIKAEAEGIKIPEIFDYEAYMRYLDS